MAFTLTPQLKLRVDSNLTANAKYNLNKIDTLAGVYYVSTSETLYVRSKENIIFSPQDASLGGTGTGGAIQFGQDGQNVDSFSVFADEVILAGSLATEGALKISDGTYYISFEAPVGLTSNIIYSLPINNGDSGQFLKTDGNGVLSWGTASGGGGGSQTFAAWLSGDGATKTVTHGFGTRKVMVEVIDDSQDYETIQGLRITRPTNNTVTLESSSAPSSAWTIMIRSVE